jgi:hypothetical protein
MASSSAIRAGRPPRIIIVRTVGPTLIGVDRTSSVHDARRHLMRTAYGPPDLARVMKPLNVDRQHREQE